MSSAGGPELANPTALRWAVETKLTHVLEWAVDMNTGSSWIPAGQNTGLRAITLLVWSPRHKGMLVVNGSTSHLDTGFWHVHCLFVFFPPNNYQ